MSLPLRTTVPTAVVFIDRGHHFLPSFIAPSIISFILRVENRLK